LPVTRRGRSSRSTPCALQGYRAVVALGGHGGPPLRWDYLFRVHYQKPRSLRKLAMTNKRVVIAIGAQRREAISGGYMRSRCMFAMTNFVFSASFVVQNRVNYRIDLSSAEVLTCRLPVGATLRGCPRQAQLKECYAKTCPYNGIIDVNPGDPAALNAYSRFTTHYSPFTIHYSLFTIHYSPQV